LLIPCKEISESFETAIT